MNLKFEEPANVFWYDVLILKQLSDEPSAGSFCCVVQCYNIKCAMHTLNRLLGLSDIHLHLVEELICDNGEESIGRLVSFQHSIVFDKYVHSLPERYAI